MKDTRHSNIENIISWQGGWASKFFLDYSISNHINKVCHNFELADKVAQQASGLSAVRYFETFAKLAGYKLKTEIPPKTTYSKSLLDLNKVKSNENKILTSKYWFERLKEHLNTTKVFEKINQIFLSEPKPSTQNPFFFLKNWTFPILSELIPLKDNGREILFLNDKLADLCSRKWYVNDFGIPVWFENNSSDIFPSSQYFVWKLIHEATHLLHIQNYPLLNLMENPFWIAQMESLAMTAEYKILEFLETETKIPSFQNYYFNRDNIKTILLLGFFERAVRLEFEIAIYVDNVDMNNWVEEVRYSYSLIDNSVFKFIYDFHNMQGFMSAYLIGMCNYLEYENPKDLLDGTVIIFGNNDYD